MEKTHVTPEVAENIRFCVERLESGKTYGCPCNYGISDITKGKCIVEGHSGENAPRCAPCWKTACLSYIEQNAPCDKVVGARYINLINNNGIAVGAIGVLEEDDGSDCPCFRFNEKDLEAYRRRGRHGLNARRMERVRRISDLEETEKKEEVMFKFGDVIRGSLYNGWDGVCAENTDTVGKIFFMDGEVRVQGVTYSKKIGHVSCSEETLRRLIDEKNVEAIKAMIKLDKPNETKEDKPMEIHVHLDGSEIAITETMRKAVEKAVSENMPKPKSVFERVARGKTYRCVAENGGVNWHAEAKDDSDNRLFSIANYFSDDNEGIAVAHQFAMHQEIWRKLTKFAMENGGVAETDNEYFTIVRDFRKTTYHPVMWHFYNVTCDVRFKTKEQCQRAIDEVLLPYLASHPDFEW